MEEENRQNSAFQEGEISNLLNAYRRFNSSEDLKQRTARLFAVYGHNEAYGNLQTKDILAVGGKGKNRIVLKETNAIEEQVENIENGEDDRELYDLVGVLFDRYVTTLRENNEEELLPYVAVYVLSYGFNLCEYVDWGKVSSHIEEARELLRKMRVFILYIGRNEALSLEWVEPFKSDSMYRQGDSLGSIKIDIDGKKKKGLRYYTEWWIANFKENYAQLDIYNTEDKSLLSSITKGDKVEIEEFVDSMGEIPNPSECGEWLKRYIESRNFENMMKTGKVFLLMDRIMYPWTWQNKKGADKNKGPFVREAERLKLVLNFWRQHYEHLIRSDAPYVWTSLLGVDYDKFKQIKPIIVNGLKEIATNEEMNGYFKLIGLR